MASFVEIGFRIDAVLSNNFSSVFSKSGVSISQLKEQLGKLQSQSGQIQSFQRLKDSVVQNTQQYNVLKNRAKELAWQIKNTSNPSKELIRDFARTTNEAGKLKHTLSEQAQTLETQRRALRESGIDTNRLSSEQRNLQQQTERTTIAQKKLQQARDNFASARQKLSWDNIKGDFMKSAGLVYSLSRPVQVNMNFEQAMARVNAVAFSGAGRDQAQDTKDFDALQKKALELGKATQFTNSQVAGAMENLARMGFSANEINSSIQGVLNMSASEGMDLAQAADIAAVSLRAFNLDASEMGRVVDVLAQASAASGASIADLGESFKYVAPIAGQIGIPIEQVAAMLGVMADNGIKGSQAGTTLKNALQRLESEPARVAKALNELGIKSSDANGNLRQIPETLEALSRRLKGMGTAQQGKYLSYIFGDQAVAGMSAMMQSVQNGRYQELEEKEYNSKGTSLEMASKLNNTLQGQITLLQSQWEGLMNTIGESLMPIVKIAVEGISKVLDCVNNLSEKFPFLFTAITDGLAAIAAYKVASKIFGIIGGVKDLIGAWHEVRTATRLASEVAGNLPNLIGASSASVGSFSASISGLLGPLSLVAGAVLLIAANWESVCEWCEKAGQAMQNIDRSTPLSEMKRSNTDYGIRTMESAYAIPELHAAGGIFGTPHLGIVAEAGREAIIPLEDKARGLALWKQAGQELGYKFSNVYNTQNISNTEITRDIPLWKAADTNFVDNFSSVYNTQNTTNADNRQNRIHTNTTKNNSVSLSPVFNFTINNSGLNPETGLEARLRGIVEDCLTNLQNDWERVSFA